MRASEMMASVRYSEGGRSDIHNSVLGRRAVTSTAPVIADYGNTAGGEGRYDYYSPTTIFPNAAIGDSDLAHCTWWRAGGSSHPCTLHG